MKPVTDVELLKTLNTTKVLHDGYTAIIWGKDNNRCRYYKHNCGYWFDITKWDLRNNKQTKFEKLKILVAYYIRVVYKRCKSLLRITNDNIQPVNRKPR